MHNAIVPDVLKALLREVLRDAAQSISEAGYFDASASAHYLGLKPRRFEVIAKEIPCHRVTVGGKRLWSRADLDAFMVKHREEVAE